MANGCIVAFGTLGAVTATAPTQWLMGEVGWRAVFAGLAGFVLIVALAISLLAREPNERREANMDLRDALRGLKEIYRDRFFWRVAIVSFIAAATYLSYQSLWIGPWLRDVGGLDSVAAGRALVVFNLGLLSGAFLIGAAADVLQRRGIKPAATLCGGLVLSLIVQSFFAAGLARWAIPLCFCFGFFGSATLLSYSVIGQHFGAALAARAGTALNVLNFLAAFLVQWAVGAIINQWPSEAASYAPAGHRAALIVAISLQLAGLVWFLWPRRQREEKA